MRTDAAATIGTLIAEVGRGAVPLQDAESLHFPDINECFRWLVRTQSDISAATVHSYNDGSALVDVAFKNPVLYQAADLTSDERERKINELYLKITNPGIHHISEAQKTVLIREMQTLISRRSCADIEQEPAHMHECATCGRSFEHDCEDECPKISGKYYCPFCYPTALEHNHTCPVCALTWTHHAAPDCSLDEDAICSRHSNEAHSDGKGLSAVAGMADLKRLLYEEVVAPIRNPERYAPWRITPPNGIMLFGPPGCGKTYIATKLAEELGYFFKEVNAASVGDTYIHGTTARIEAVFVAAEENAPAVLFLDDFEALVPERGGLGAHQHHRVEEVGEFLRQLQTAGLRKILVIAATNEPWAIDSAIQRPGRLDKRILVDVPDVAASTDMLRFHLEGRLREPALPLDRVAEKLDGYSASDLTLLVEEAARVAARKNRPIAEHDLLTAKELVPRSISKEMRRRYTSFGQRGATSGGSE